VKPETLATHLVSFGSWERQTWYPTSTRSTTALVRINGGFLHFQEKHFQLLLERTNHKLFFFANVIENVFLEMKNPPLMRTVPLSIGWMLDTRLPFPASNETRW